MASYITFDPSAATFMLRYDGDVAVKAHSGKSYSMVMTPMNTYEDVFRDSYSFQLVIKQCTITSTMFASPSTSISYEVGVT